MTPMLEAIRRLGNAGAQDNARRSCEERVSTEMRLETLCSRLAPTPAQEQRVIAMAQTSLQKIAS